MTTEERRKEIISILKSSTEPIKGTKLSKKLDVSRQVIVQDIAILRAKGYDILATPVGYVIPRYNEDRILKTIVTRHLTTSEVEEELMIIVNNGAAIIDVLVDHPIYGDVQGVLNISCKRDVDNFIKRVKDGNVEFLSALTDGVHIHTIEVADEESFKTIEKELKEKGYLVEEL